MYCVSLVLAWRYLVHKYDYEIVWFDFTVLYRIYTEIWDGIIKQSKQSNLCTVVIKELDFWCYNFTKYLFNRP